MRHRAPWVVMPPGAAAGDAPGARLRPARVALGRSGIVGLILPVETPLVARRPKARVAPRVWAVVSHRARRPIEAGAGRPRLAQGKAGGVEPAARGLLPLGLRRQAQPRPGALGPPVTVGGCVEPAQAHHRLLRIGEAGGPPTRRAGSRPSPRGTERTPIGHGSAGDGERVEPDAMPRPLARMAVLPAHPETSRRGSPPSPRGQVIVGS